MTVPKRTKRTKPDPELLKLADSLLVNYKKPEDLIGENGLLKQLTKMLVERALESEMTEHLGHAKSGAVTNTAANARNGHSGKTLKGDFGELTLEIPRDRQASFEPQLVAKHQTRWTGFDDKVISLYARGLSVREIQAHLEEMYGAEVSPSLISAITDAVSEEVKLWQARPLDALYPILYLDCIHVKVRDAGAVRNKAVYLAIGVNLAGHKEVLGLWIAQTEGAKFWLQVVTELKNGRRVTPSMLRHRFDDARIEAARKAVEAGDDKLAETVKEFRFCDIRPKAASEIEDLARASRLLGHTDKRITETVYRRVGEVVEPTR